MRFAWSVWLTRRTDGFGFERGPVKGAIGTAAVLLALALRRHRPASP
ncbi:hypothetical protein GCM10019016_069640 [Streptomyces prasinosporus]|uniref:Uncharacterized protein n=1 Tax=Streptomyces prasinosporus TaxID=68256 RepID=A0ABP6TXL0_9ACTN